MCVGVNCQDGVIMQQFRNGMVVYICVMEFPLFVGFLEKCGEYPQIALKECTMRSGVYEEQLGLICGGAVHQQFPGLFAIHMVALIGITVPWWFVCECGSSCVQVCAVLVDVKCVEFVLSDML